MYPRTGCWRGTNAEVPPPLLRPTIKIFVVSIKSCFNISSKATDSRRVPQRNRPWHNLPGSRPRQAYPNEQSRSRIVRSGSAGEYQDRPLYRRQDIPCCRSSASPRKDSGNLARGVVRPRDEGSQAIGVVVLHSTIEDRGVLEVLAFRFRGDRLAQEQRGDGDGHQEEEKEKRRRGLSERGRT